MLSLEYRLRRRPRGVRFFTTVAVLALLLVNVTAFAQWPQWGGPKRDFKAPSKKLARKWPSQGPRALWTYEEGRPGISSILVHREIVYFMCRFDDWEEALMGLNEKTGVDEITMMFRAPVPEPQRKAVSTSPRSTPIVIGDYVYVMSFTGKLVCYNQPLNNYEWTQNLLLDFNGTALEHGYTSSLIGYQDRVIIQLGGLRVGFIAIEGPDEKAAWLSPPFENSYASPIIVDVDGEDQLIGMAADKVVAVSPEDGRARWTYPHESRGPSHLIAPVWGPDHLLFLPSSREGEECRMLKVTRDGKRTNLEQLWASSDVKLGPGNVIRVGDYLYGSGGSNGASYITAVKAATGEVAWRDSGFSLAAMCYADGMLIIRDSDGVVAVATPGPEKLTVHSKFKPLAKSPPSVPVVVGTKLFVRDDAVVRAFDLARK